MRSPHTAPFHALVRALLATCTGLLACAALAQVGPSTELKPPARTTPIAPVPPTWPGPRLLSPQARQPIQIARASVQAEIVGQAARSHIEIVFKNPNAQVLEGELQFPLADGQSVAGFALDINGEMRPAVPVEKAKGQQVFEDTIRRNVDPALLEKTQGNNHKLRIYPLPALGERRVSLELVETLPVRQGQALYRVPLQWQQPMGQVEVSIRLPGAAPQQVQPGRGLPDAMKLALPGDGQAAAGTLVQWHQKDHTARQPMELGVAVGRAPYSATQSFDGQTFFYAEVPLPDGYAVPGQPTVPPKRLGLVWDASGSGTQRDLPRELALLDTLFATWAKQGGLELNVDLVLVRDTATTPQRFVVRQGEWRALRQALEAVAYDGATAASGLVAVAGCDVSLLFSDGLANFGPAAPMAVQRAVLHAVQSSPSANTAWLRLRAESSGGQLLDLTRTPPKAAAQALTQASGRVTGWRGEGLRDVVLASRRPDTGRVQVAGVLTEARTTLTLSFETASGQTRQVSVPLQAEAHGALAASRWASLTLDAWEAEPEQHAGDILRLGQRFGLASSQTSLIVLDSVADYVRHEINPPASLREAYERQLAQKRTAKQAADQQHLEDVVRRFQGRLAWYERDHAADAVARRAAEEELRRQASARADVARPVTAMAMAPSPAAPPAPAPMAAGAPTLMREMAAAPKAAGHNTATEATAATTTLSPWQASEDYSRRMQAATAEQAYALYLQERPSRSSSAAFFQESAEVLFAKGADALALRVLSNLAEIASDNRAVLRILAYRLQQAGRTELALPVLLRVRQLAPQEPQSWRDAGLALAELGQTQAAVNALWQVVSRPWDARFRDVDLTTLAELNAVVASAGTDQLLDLSQVDPRLRRHLPLGLRVVLRWDADNTDVDLHVVEPSGEEAMFSHALTAQGGKMSADVTGGYGPEEYALRSPQPGVYKVRAKFYGHRQQTVSNTTTVQAEVTTGFGTPAQQTRWLTLRLGGSGEVADVGTVTVEPAGNPR